MLSCCLKCKKKTKKQKQKLKFVKKHRRIIIPSNCVVCGSKQSRFIKEQEATGLSRNLTGINTPILSDLTIANVLF